ncbi:hypothetical protein MBGDN05_00116 [Thermoplasmatales archaeon SCGC AB-539-N05]|nr:hypothetical protein MBGDN05_00116 [Thermoplasmatales archaeon SCGC AB-539-N05]
MHKRKNLTSSIVILALSFILLCSAILPGISVEATVNTPGFDKGPSYKPVVPMKKVTFVNFDEESYLDDYAYLAAVPTAVFDDGDKLYSNPLLFYQDEYPVEEDKERSLNARQGLDYFMEDWMSYCNGQLDKMTLINVPKNKLDSSWKSKNYTMIENDNPYDVASELALSEWSYSDSAVIAVIDDEFEELDYNISGRLTGEIPSIDIKKEHFEVPQTNQLDPIYNEFTVPEEYKYLNARAWYSCLTYGIGIKGFQSIATISIPSGDKDLQLYCKYNGDWMESAAVSEWNQKFGMDKEIVETYVYEDGPWRVAITDIPTKGLEGHYGTWAEILRNLILGVIYQVDIEMYPGVVIPIPDLPPFGCRDATFELTWDDTDVQLGFCLIGPSGEEVLSDADEKEENEPGVLKMHLDQLGECLDGESYSICVFAMDDVSRSIDFEVEYSWGQGISEDEGAALTSATEGAVLASVLNAPLLYTSKSRLADTTKDVLYALGVENVRLVDIGENLDDDTLKEIRNIADIKEHFTVLKDIYDNIRDETGSNDIVFSTLDPWSYWYVTEMKPAGEFPGALHLGPAAYIAAHHGTSVLIVDNHPELSSAIVWHNEFWKRTAHSPVGHDPCVSEMYITGTRVYNFLREYGFDQLGRETIISVAGQYDISPSWDRMFPGMAKSGKFLYSPVDTSYWISRNVFYPALIFVNPAMDPNGVELTTGGESERRTVFARGPLGLKITKQPGKETFKYPVHLTYASYTHRFNERASKYYGFKYQSADDIIPGETRSLEPIDQGSIKQYTGKEGCFWPDMSTSDVVPFYMERGGFEPAFSSTFVDTMNNLNEGVLYWFLASHGGHPNSGLLIFWDPEGEGAARGCSGIPLPPGAAAKKDINPWRSYDWYLGSTEEPDTLSAEIHGVIPAILGNPNINGLVRTAFDWGPAKKPIRDIINNFLAKVPIVNKVLPEGQLDTQDYYDGQICGALLSTLGYTWYSGWAVDDALDNIHSMVFLTGVCLTATKYAHLSIVRHGSVSQIIDPWPTSWYGSMWMQSVPRDMILGDTIGEAYNKGISHVGILYIGDDGDPPQWWWDTAENVCLFGDPDLRMFVPGTDYSDANYWERDDVQPIRYDAELSVDGHMPYGATDYPNEITPMPWMQYIWIIVAVALLATIAIMAFVFFKKQKR